MRLSETGGKNSDEALYVAGDLADSCKVRVTNARYIYTQFGSAAESCKMQACLQVYADSSHQIYNIAKNRMMQESPEDEANRKIEAMYSNKRRELEDSMWMDRVRSMRDELRRNYRRMSTEEYTKKYVDLMDALNERSS